MHDMKTHEPDIQILYPLLIHYSPEAAILYGYLKEYCQKNITLQLDGDYSCYHFKISRYQIEQATGLSYGEQIDAEVELIGADVAIGSGLNNDQVDFYLYPSREDSLRRFVYSKRYNWA